MADIPSPRMRAPEVCAMLLCSRDHLYKLDRLGKLRKHRESVRFVYWLREEVEAYAKGRAVTSAGEGEAAC